MNPRRVMVSAAFLAVLGCGSRETAPFSDLLAEIDDYLVLGAVTRAQESIEQAYDKAATAADWMRLARRSFSASTAAGDYGPLVKTAKFAFEEFPGRTDFSAILAWAYARSGDSRRAYRVSREYLDGTEWQSLADELFLSSATGAGGGEDAGLEAFGARASASSGGLSGISRYRPDLGRDEAVFLSEAAVRLAEPRLFLDAALIYAGIGEIEAAAGLAVRFERTSPLPAAYLLYDSGRTDEAVSLLKRLIDAGDSVSFNDMLVYADILHADGEASAALAVCRDLIASGRTETWLPYANAAALLRVSGSVDSAIEIVSSGLALFPSNRELLVELARLQIASGRTDSALATVNSLRAAHPTASDAAYLEFEIRGGQAARRRLITTLKEVFFAGPENAMLARNLASLLAGERNYADLEAVLDAYERAAGVAAWSAFYRGLGAVGRNDPKAALDHFMAAAELSDDRRHLFNVGVVLSALSEQREARKYLRGAAALADDPRERARIIFEIARTLVREGDASAAIREAKYALDIDPELSEARVLLYELEAGGN